MCTGGFTCLPENTCKPLRLRRSFRLRRRIVLLVIDEGIISEELIIDGRL
jgi:hypothetical protein